MDWTNPNLVPKRNRCCPLRFIPVAFDALLGRLVAVFLDGTSQSEGTTRTRDPWLRGVEALCPTQPGLLAMTVSQANAEDDTDAAGTNEPIVRP